MTGVPTGDYQVFVHVWEDTQSEQFDLVLNDRMVAEKFHSGLAGSWKRLGPWPVRIEDGQLRLLAKAPNHGAANLSGLEVWSGDGAVPDPSKPVFNDDPTAEQFAFFESRIRPVFVEHCHECHSAGATKLKGGLLLDSKAGARKGGDSGPLMNPASPDSSLLVRAVRHEDPALAMPPRRRIPEAAVAMLACARIGAAHSVVFGGFSAHSLRDRINDAEAKVLITADGGHRRGDVFALKPVADEALADTPTITDVVVVRRGGNDVEMLDGRDHWYHDLMEAADPECVAEPMDAEQLLFLLYTSGTTGKPKGIMHTSGGYLTQTAFTHKYVFDLHDDDVYWCTADVGWITGHSYIVYGPLANGATQVMYEGVPNFPGNDRFWEIIESYRVTKFYTAPTAIRTFMKWGIEEPAKHDLSSLKVLGSVGEPINPEAWMWYHEHIGGGRCPIVDTWWQTETGGIMISPLPGATTTKPGSATFPLPGIGAELVDESGVRVDRGGGYLTLTRPWPGMLRGIWGDQERYRETYWSRFDGRYFAGDGAKLDDDGYLWLLGRVDDVMNVSGHRISTTEVESALVAHPAVAEAAVVGATDATTGQAIIAYVTLRGGAEVDEQALRAFVGEEIGHIAKPKTIYFTPDLPKTRSGKIMRRLLRDVAEGRNLGDTSTLADANVVTELQRRAADVPAED
jgi:acetyl-CoA synthetase